MTQALIAEAIRQAKASSKKLIPDSFAKERHDATLEVIEAAQEVAKDLAGRCIPVPTVNSARLQAALLVWAKVTIL